MRPLFPVLGPLALGRLQHAGIDQAARFQVGERGVDGAGLDERPFRRKHVVADAECGQVAPDPVHHVGDGKVAGADPVFRAAGRRVGPLARWQLQRRFRRFDHLPARIEAVEFGFRHGIAL